MIRVLLTLCLFNSLGNAAPQKPPEILGLKAAFESALTKNETLPIAESKKAQAEEQVDQTVGAILPSLSFSASYLRQDDSANPSGGNSSTRPDQTSAKLTVTQPLFRGFREFNTLRSKKLNYEAAEAHVTSERLRLFRDVALSFYGTLDAQKNVENRHALLELMSRRITELESRVRIGRSRKGELLSAQAQLAIIRSELETAETELVRARETFHRQTGLTASAELDETELDREPTLRPLDNYLEELKKHPEKLKYSLLADSAYQEVKAARGAHLPTVDATGNYYLKRTGALADSQWDVGVTLTLPIFQGGILQSQIQESVEREKELRLEQSAFDKAALEEIRSLHQAVQSALANVRSLREAVRLSDSNYKEHQKDYGVGVATNLEVLQALDTLYKTKRLFDRSRYDLLSSYVALTTQSGTLP